MVASSPAVSGAGRWTPTLDWLVRCFWPASSASTSALRSTYPRFAGAVPRVKALKLSPPPSRNVDPATTYVLSGSMGAPSMVTEVIFDPTGAVGS